MPVPAIYDDFQRSRYVGHGRGGNGFGSFWSGSCQHFGSTATVRAASELGNLEVGKRAVFLVRRSDVSENLGLDPALEFAVIADAGTIDSVFVDGK
ncbi:hypothetical protein EN803_16460 [Mesorhizobium sp. M2D.F.Ca.ET.160.01.1.1]|nr:hypothetical protein EN803_16460 [Mesorhizobium sp. M2D.F.Ca.ET.160.01.1.1]